MVWVQHRLHWNWNKEYKIIVEGKDLGVSKTDVGGKITFDVELKKGVLVQVKIIAA